MHDRPSVRRPPQAPGFLASIESVRGIAALYVAVAHTMIYLLFIHYTTPLFDLASRREMVIRVAEGLIHGPMAVMVFFVISGVVIGRSLDGRRDSRPSGAPRPPHSLSAQNYVLFLIRRALRLYPAHIAALTGILVIGWLCLHGQPPLDFSAYQPADDIYFTDWLDAVFNPLHVKTVVANYAMVRWSMNLVVWSLFVELCAAPLLPLFHAVSRRRLWTVDIATTGLLLALAAAMWGHLAVQYWFAFYLGMIVDTRGRDFVALVTKHLPPSAVLGLAYAVMVLPAILWTDRPPITAMLETAGAFGLISLVVWCRTLPLVRALEHPVLRWNGRLSYSFYLWHYFILTMAVRGLYLAASPAWLYRNDVAVCAVTAAATIGIAWAVAQLSYNWVEVPFIALGRKLAAALYARPSRARRARLIDMTQEQAAP